MRYLDGQLLLSASDLTRMMGCEHATTLDLARLRGEGPEPRPDSEDAELLQQYGMDHEAGYLRALQLQGRDVCRVPAGDLMVAAAATRDAMVQGAEIIYQGAVFKGQWGGWADFIERVDKPSALGTFSYEVSDTKLKRSVHPKHVLQLVLYSDLIADIQGTPPEFAHVVLGDGRRESLRLSDYADYARAARARLEAFVSNPPATRPIPCADCGLCRWADHCESVWQAEDSLFNVANIARGQVKKLESAGVRTLQALAEQDGPVRGMANLTLDKLKVQARLQHARKTGEPAFEHRPAEPGKGFGLLPEPQPGDVFYDIEGDPHFPGGLEYLHGLRFDGKFKPFWAHDHAQEREALIQLMDFFAKRLTSHPAARIYHYAPYEVTALRRLTKKYGVGEAMLDRLLRERRFVDLYAVVRSGLVCSEANYSIKSLEVFYGFERTGEVRTAGGSVVAYEKWRVSGEQAILDEIKQYNEADCVSTQKLRDWLVSIRPDGPWPLLGKDAKERAQQDEEEDRALRHLLEQCGLSEERREMLFNLARFHKREAKPAWWAIFDSLGQDEDQLMDDLDALAGLTAIGPRRPVDRSQERDYVYPRQETKIRTGGRASVATPEGFASVSVSHLDRQARTVTLKIGNARAHLLADRMVLHPDAPLDTQVIAAALSDVVADQCGSRNYRAVEDLLSRSAPRLRGLGEDILGGAEPLAGTIAAIHAMDETVLPVQGPPGTGKTFVAARAIMSLVKAGHRVGVASNSHEAIRNVLLGCLDALDEQEKPFPLDIRHKMSGQDLDYPDGSPVQVTLTNEAAEEGRDIVGGTAFFFARDENIQAFDWLFVDEAGQVSLANMVAMGRAARNIVLVGDPQQLPQVIQGAHPAPANLSCLEWMLNGHATIPPQRGIFLATTRRMHPEVNAFISQQFYEGRLVHHPDTAQQAVTGTGFPASGVHRAPVEHEGHSQVCDEEVAAIREACTRLLGGTWRSKDGSMRPMTEGDIIVVAPYNVQVNALRAALPPGVRVGTVDKFQGQEAPVCIVSMTASSAEEIPRGMDFLFSLNRTNVAISRAMALALVFGSPRLRQAPCGTVIDMRRVNALCVLSEVDMEAINA